MTNVIWAPRSTYSSGRMAAIIPMPTKLNEPRRTNTRAVGTLSTWRSSCRKNTSITIRIAPVCRSPYTIAYRHEPSSCVQRRMGAMNVYSSVPSHRSTWIVSAIQPNTTDR